MNPACLQREGAPPVSPVVFALPILLLVVHFAVGNGYGFHRDELQFLSDARHLAWGFTAYPPLTSLCGRVAISLFGVSPQVLRLPAALANGLTLTLAALMARELGGRRVAQVMAQLAVFPVALIFSMLLQYTTFDMLAWTVMELFTARLLRTGDKRNWLGVGLGVGLGVLSKYAIAFAVLSLLAGVLVLPSQRHHLRRGWFWAGALVALAIAAPNLLWLARHGFITLRMEQWIHARDIRLGRAKGFWVDQLKFTVLAMPLVLVGLRWLVLNARFRLLSAFFFGPLVLFACAKGRGYYMLPAYPVAYAAAMVAVERWLAGRTARAGRGWWSAVGCAVGLNALTMGSLYLPIFPAGSQAWRWQMKNSYDLADEVGWPEIVAQVAAVRDHLPPAELSRLAVLADNYGEAGAVELYGPRFGLPAPISTVNSFWQRGYGRYVPNTFIVLGSRLEDERSFGQCEVAGRIVIPFGVRNEESEDHPEILVCRHLRGNLPEIWAREQTFG